MIAHAVTKNGFCESRRSRLFCSLNGKDEWSFDEVKKLIHSFLHESEKSKYSKELEKIWNLK